MVFDLQGRDRVAGVSLQVEEGLGLRVGDSDGFCEAGVDDFFERGPGFAEGDVFEGDCGAGGVLPPCLFVERGLVLGIFFFGLWGSGLTRDVQGISVSQARRISVQSGSE